MDNQNHLIWYIESDTHRNYTVRNYKIKKNGLATFDGYRLSKSSVYERGKRWILLSFLYFVKEIKCLKLFL